jgi:hypothetical protein
MGLGRKEQVNQRSINLPSSSKCGYALFSIPVVSQSIYDFVNLVFHFGLVLKLRIRKLRVPLGTRISQS